MTQANEGDTVRIHYSGKLTDGTLFDSSAGNDPLEFKIGDNTIIPKLEASVVGMTVGDKAIVEIDADDACVRSILRRRRRICGPAKIFRSRGLFFVMSLQILTN